MISEGEYTNQVAGFDKSFEGTWLGRAMVVSISVGVGGIDRVEFVCCHFDCFV